MRKSNQTLQGLDAVLAPAIERAVCPSFSGKTPTAFDIGIKLHRELDNTRTSLSEALYKIDLANDDIGVKQAQMHQLQSMRPYNTDAVDTNDYIRKANNGYQVWDGNRWTQLSKDAKIKITSERSEATNNKLAVVIQAEDTSTNTQIFFVDDNVYKRGGEISYNGSIRDNPELSPRMINEEINWQSILYDATKMGVATTGKAAGALSLTRIGNLTPWHKGANLHKAVGWYRNKEGIYRSLSSQRNTIGAGGHRVGARTAAKSVKHLKLLGRRIAIISVGISVHEVIDAYKKDDFNKNQVITKAGVDIAMTVIGTLGGPVGWFISGSYLILSTTGAFGDWGTPSGVNSNGIPYGNTNFGTTGGASSQYTDEFTIDYVPPIEHKRSKMRERLYRMQDHTAVQPQVHYQVNMEGQDFFPRNQYYTKF
ncbi:hypothetical protein [Aquimarina longa]|uniref:hypothetical protein n=1 Tax=Aquimarina longa TaxID=1080221 RepID=UPI000782A36E|nr:hypothetical protein [Aquimarina longa]